ncbi:MAG: AhpC/TSA family protein [Deltaproteobacteria bacterium]|nr:AhpC/TSA family protein [Deltaproteobacteria bacterium]
MQRQDGEFKKIGAQVVIVSFAPWNALQSYQKIHQWRYPIFSDSQRKFYRLLGLQKGAFFQIFHPKTVMNYARYLTQGKKIEKTKEDIYQLGGNFIFDRQGVYRFGYPSQRPDDRPPVFLLIQKLSELS